MNRRIFKIISAAIALALVFVYRADLTDLETYERTAFPSAPSRENASTSAPQPAAVVTRANTALRSSPGGRVVTRFAAGVPVTVFDEGEPGWLNVRINGLSGWVADWAVREE